MTAAGTSNLQQVKMKIKMEADFGSWPGKSCFVFCRNGLCQGLPWVGVGWDGRWWVNQINWVVQGVDADWYHLLCFVGAVPGLLQPSTLVSEFFCLVFFFFPEKCPFPEVVFGYYCPEQETDSWLSWELACHGIFPVKGQPGTWQMFSSALRRRAQNPKHWCFGGGFFLIHK